MEEFIFRPNFEIAGKHGKPITIDLYEQTLPGPHPVVIFSHGFKGFKDWGPFNIMAKRFAEAGFNFLKFNFAFNGTTPDSQYDFADLNAFGENNFTRELDDLETVIDWVCNDSGLEVDLSKLYIFGHSRGGAISLIKASEDSRVKSVCGWAAVAEFARHISKKDVLKWKADGVFYVENARTGQQMPLHLQLYNDYIKNHRRLNIRKAVRNIQFPFLLIHGSEDETVPFLHAVELYNENPVNCRLIEIKAALHTFGAAHPQEGIQLPPDFEIAIRETIRFFHSQ